MRATSQQNQVSLWFLVGALCATVLSLAPVMLVYHRSLNTFFVQQCWQNSIFYIIAIFFGGIAMSKGQPHASEANVRSRHYWWQLTKKCEFSMFISFCFFLYVACCALCQKLDFTTLPADTVAKEVWKTIGLLTLLVAMTMQAQIFPIVRVAHPIYFSCLLLLLGLPLLFSVWMPLFAVPGAFIIFKWRINMQAKKRQLSMEGSGDMAEPVEQLKQRWQLVPYLF